MRKKETSWMKVAAAVAAIKIMPFKKLLLGTAAVAGTAFAIRHFAKRLKAADVDEEEEEDDSEAEAPQAKQASRPSGRAVHFNRFN